MHTHVLKNHKHKSWKQRFRIYLYLFVLHMVIQLIYFISLMSQMSLNPMSLHIVEIVSSFSQNLSGDHTFTLVLIVKNHVRFVYSESLLVYIIEEKVYKSFAIFI